jgi:hypothetical protein
MRRTLPKAAYSIMRLSAPAIPISRSTSLANSHEAPNGELATGKHGHETHVLPEGKSTVQKGSKKGSKILLADEKVP